MNCKLGNDRSRTEYPGESQLTIVQEGHWSELAVHCSWTHGLSPLTGSTFHKLMICLGLLVSVSNFSEMKSIIVTDLYT